MAKGVKTKVPFVPIERKKASEEEIKTGLELLAKRRHTAERVKAGELKTGTSSYVKRGDLSPEALKKVKGREARYQARAKLLLQKARDAGIKVTDAEIDAYLKK